MSDETRAERVARTQAAFDAWAGQTQQDPDDWDPNVDQENRLAEFQAAEPA